MTTINIDSQPYYLLSLLETMYHLRVISNITGDSIYWNAVMRDDKNFIRKTVNGTKISWDSGIVKIKLGRDQTDEK